MGQGNETLKRVVELESKVKYLQLDMELIFGRLYPKKPLILEEPTCRFSEDSIQKSGDPEELKKACERIRSYEEEGKKMYYRSEKSDEN